MRGGGRTRRRGFTLIELLTVVVIVGLLAGLAVGRYQRSKARTFVASVQADLRKVAVSQEQYFAEHSTYSASPTDLNLAISPGVVITLQAQNFGWSAVGRHPRADPVVCAVFWGVIAVPAPAQSEGQVACE